MIATGQAGCVFCDRINRGEYVNADSRVVWFEPLNPVTPGHMLFVPRLHVWSASADPGECGAAMRAAARYARMVGGDFNLITSSGEAATQTVWHLHVHYVPRREGDGLHLPWTGQTERAEAAAAMRDATGTIPVEQLREALKFPAGDDSAETRLIDRLCRCSRPATEAVPDCLWHHAVSAQYAADLQAEVRRLWKWEIERAAAAGTVVAVDVEGAPGPPRWDEALYDALQPRLDESDARWVVEHVRALPVPVPLAPSLPEAVEVVMAHWQQVRSKLPLIRWLADNMPTDIKANDPAPGWEPDWTFDADGVSNASDRFVRLSLEVARLIRSQAHALLSGQTETVGRLIMAQLAHRWHMIPEPGTPDGPTAEYSENPDGHHWRCDWCDWLGVELPTRAAAEAEFAAHVNLYHQPIASADS